WRYPLVARPTPSASVVVSPAAIPYDSWLVAPRILWVGIDPVDFSPYALECNPKLFERAVILLDVIGFDMEVKGLELVSTTTVGNHQGIP
nr:hypothetical protein [Tanacetum cinerariifolium]